MYTHITELLVRICSLGPVALPWVQVLSAIVFGVAAILIAHSQLRTNKNKLAIDLFQLRYWVYTETGKYLRASSAGELNAEQRNAFLDAVIKSRFLFGEKMHAFLDRLHLEGSKVTHHMTGDKFEVVQQHSDHLARLNDLFRPYLDVGKLVEPVR